ncbi:hypothetical protein [Paraburkholderia dilworthii]|uniref:Uncharacterized protein n=1 Tax=Paraburkholderia dilworthii TaxID=948106 RepID=A0ABW9D806_9BURK
MIPNTLSLLNLAWAALTLQLLGAACVVLDAPFPVVLTLLCVPLFIHAIIALLVLKPAGSQRHEQV